MAYNRLFSFRGNTIKPNYKVAFKDIINPYNCLLKNAIFKNQNKQ